MCESYTRSLLRVSVAQICQALGWDSVQLTACDLLTDVLHRYIQQLARGCHRYSELYGRTDPVLDDVGQAFKLLGLNLSELEDYIHNLEPVGFAHQIPLFPVSKNNILQFPQHGTRDAEERKEYIPEYMPPIVSSQEEEEEEHVPTDGGTSAEAMQVPLEEEEDEMEDDEAVNDENILGKRQLESPESVDMPVAKRPKLAGIKTESPERVVEMREPLTLINPQKVPPVQSPVKANDTSVSLPPSPEPPAPVPKVQLLPPKSVDPKLSTPKVKSKMNSSSQKTKSPKAANFTVVAGSPIRSPKPVPKEKKSPGRTKSPKSPKSPKAPLNVNHPAGKADTPIRTPLAVLSEKMGKENILLKQGQLQSDNEKDTSENLLKKLPEIDNTIDDSIDAVIARACAEREPDPFAFSSGSESEGEIFTSPRRLTISEPLTPKVTLNANSSIKGNVTSVPPVGTSSSDNSWTMDDSINEVIRKVSLGTPSSLPPNPPYLSSPSASPPTPEPLLKLYEEKTKLATSVDVKKKLKKELKTKIKKKEKEKQKEKDREKEKGKEKNKDKIKDKEKDKEINKETKLQWKDLSKEDEQEPVKFKLKEFDESDTRTKAKDAPTKKEKDKHKDKKKDKEKGKKDKEKKEKGKDKAREEKLKNQGTLMSPKETQLPLFSAQAGVRLSSMLSTLSPILPEKLFEEKEKPKEKEKKKEKKEKKKKKDKEKEKDKEKVKDKEKEKEKEKKEKEKEKKEKEKDKEKDKHKHEKTKVEPPVPAPSPVIPRLTLRVGAGQDKIVISKVVSPGEAKAPIPKTPVQKTPAPAARPKSPPLPPPPMPTPSPAHSVPPLPPPIPPLTPIPVPAAVSPVSVPPPSPAVPLAGSSKTPVRSVVTETVSTYVIRDEWGNQIWICPGCNKPDDGSPMIGCDDCDDWYHWPCVGIMTPPPEEVQWYCPKCANKKKDKKHKKRKHKVH